MRQEADDDFQCWLVDMDDALERFLRSLPPDVAARLDYSPPSLAVLEAWILQKYPTTYAMLAPTESQTVDALGRYIGETFRKTLGGHWEIRTDDPDYAFHGLPQLTGFWANSTPECPVTLVTASADRRTGTYVTGVLSSYLRERERRSKASPRK